MELPCLALFVQHFVQHIRQVMRPLPIFGGSVILATLQEMIFVRNIERRHTARRAVSRYEFARPRRTFASTYSASFKMYSGSEPRRLYDWSKISTRTLLLWHRGPGLSCGSRLVVLLSQTRCRTFPSSQPAPRQSFDLRQHFFYTAANLLALLAQAHHFAAQRIHFLFALL